MKNYNKFEEIDYERTNLNLDKRFSILPTVLHLLQPIPGRDIIDVGCGSGFFTLPIAELSPNHVYGIDNCLEQIELAKRRPHPRISYAIGDMFGELPSCDRINASFVLNYAKTTGELRSLVYNFHHSLTRGGKLVAAVDLPKPYHNSKQMEQKKNLGVIKTLKGDLKDETQIILDFYNCSKLMFSLSANYFTPGTIVEILSDVGFTNIEWHQPLIANDSPLELWQNYLELCELGYVTANKK
jgi:SAM-dependent methyltransferase